ncbi:MAG: VOC family protein [Deltaproteobacteria bacterium]|nr:VOC family protein [Deltaproteobacteria bacterium]
MIQITAVDHIYLAVSDLPRSERFYDRVFRLFDFRKGTAPIGGERHAHYFNRITQYTIRQARTPGAHDPYRVGGLHHLCFRVPARRDVDQAYEGLTKLGIAASAPRLFPEYAEDYYATFFEDPDGVRLEVVAERRLRTLLRERWEELTEFEDPVRKSGIA